ncbi:MAG: sugar ABC transporter permease [Acetobacteraceae bacterium]|nr:sugar ABC transporter permease [Acetobacteraceae bacterium]
MGDSIHLVAAGVGQSLTSHAPIRPVGSLARLTRQKSMIAIALCVPLIALILGLKAWPTIYGLYLSMLNRKMTEFIFLDNYIFLLGRNTFQMVIFQSCLFAITAVIAKATLGFVIAHLMHNIRGRYERVWRGLLLVPWVIPLALSTLSWWWLLDPSYSALNWTLEWMGFSKIAFLGETWNARIMVIIVNTWFGAPFFMIMYLAALKSVPEQLYEAAAIDGANAWQKLIYVTLPMMRNIIAITVLYSMIVTFADFDIVRILTMGGPQDSTHLFATYAFTIGISSSNIPRGAATSLFMLPIMATFAFLILRGVNKRNKEIAA